MKIEVGAEGELRFKDVYNSVVFETKEGEELVVCMRDGAFEIALLNRDPRGSKKIFTWYKADSNGITADSPSVSSNPKDNLCLTSGPLDGIYPSKGCRNKGPKSPPPMGNPPSQGLNIQSRGIR